MYSAKLIKAQTNQAIYSKKIKINKFILMNSQSAPIAYSLYNIDFMSITYTGPLFPSFHLRYKHIT